MERGMDFVTITDHDTIDGCLQIRNLPNTFISEQVTTYFPQDPCKVHILVWGISEAQHADIQIARENIFVLQRYLQTGKIAHAVAHPLYSINGKLNARHPRTVNPAFQALRKHQWLARRAPERTRPRPIWFAHPGKDQKICRAKSIGADPS